MKRNIFYLMSSKVIWVLSGFIIHVCLGRLLGPRLYGMFGVVTAFTSIGYLILGGGVRRAVSKYTAANPDLVEPIKTAGLKVQIPFSMAIGAALALLSKPISSSLGDPDLSGLLKLAALIIPFTGILFVYVGSMEGSRRFGRTAAVSVTYAVSRAVFVLLFVLLGLKVRGAVIGLILATSLAALMSRRLYGGFEGKGDFSSGALMRFAVPVSLFFMATALLMHIDILFVKLLLGGSEQAGFYASAQALSRPIYFVFGVFGVILLPSISKAMADGDLWLARRYISRSLRYMAMLLLPLAFLISASSDELIALFYDRSFAPASFPLSILVFGIAFLSMSLALSAIIQGYGRPGVPLIILLCSVSLNICLLLTLTPLLRLPGAALATTATCLANMIALSIYVHSKFKALPSPTSLFRITLSSSILFPIAAGVIRSGALLLPGCVGLLGFYILTLRTLGEVRGEDLIFIRGMLDVKRRRG